MLGCRTASKVAAVAAVLGSCRTITESNGGNRKKASMHFGVDPSKLDLGLDLSTMDFTAIVNSTKDAMSSDRALTRGFRDAKLFDTDFSELEPSGTNASPSDPVKSERHFQGHGSSSSSGHHHQSQQRSIRGIVNAGAAHDTNAPAVAYAQAQSERSIHSKQTLMDALRDCTLSGNWSKAFRTFNEALEKSFQNVVVAPKEGMMKSAAEIHEENLAAVYKLNAALPPLHGTDRSTAITRHNSLKNVAGILRWHGGHYFMVMKCLVNAGRFQEAQIVWDTMKKIGFVDFHIEERTVNSLIALTRRSGQIDALSKSVVAGGSGEDTTTTDASNTTTSANPGMTAKSFKRQFTIDLEKVAKEKNFALLSSNERSVKVARIAEALHHNSEHLDSSNGSEPRGSASLRVGDFNDLLRVATSHASTLKILGMMETLGIPKDSSTYANIISSLRNPSYLVQGASENEISTSAPSTMDRVEGKAEYTGANEGKERYEAYKDKRIKAAREWFHSCPEDSRTADVYNQLLAILSAKHLHADYDELLSEFRGAALRTKEDLETIQLIASHKKSQENDGVGADATAPPQCPEFTNSRWRTPPNSKTYELLILRCRFYHDWDAMWALYDEMRVHNVRGTQRLYQALMAEAKRHPPTRARDRSSFILELYDEMKQNRFDVTTIDNTLNLVNAWSSARSRSRSRWT